MKTTTTVSLLLLHKRQQLLGPHSPRGLVVAHATLRHQPRHRAWLIHDARGALQWGAGKAGSEEGRGGVMVSEWQQQKHHARAFTKGDGCGSGGGEPHRAHAQYTTRERRCVHTHVRVRRTAGAWGGVVATCSWLMVMPANPHLEQTARRIVLGKTTQGCAARGVRGCVRAICLSTKIRRGSERSTHGGKRRATRAGNTGNVNTFPCW
jgi:hypothetical protein